MTKQGTEAKVGKLPNCDICIHVEHREEPNLAAYDCKTQDGPWAFVCEEHYPQWRFYSELGMGKGQRLVLVS